MSWHFSQALVEEYWEENSLDGDLSALLKSTDTQLAFFSQGKMTESSRRFQSGMTYVPLTENLGEGVLMWFLEDFLARTLVQPVKGQELKEKEADCGLKCYELLTNASHPSFLSKTPHYLENEDFLKYCQDLPKAGSMRNGVVYPQAPLERPIKDKECGYSLPTPTGCRSGKNHIAGRLDEWGGSSNPFRGTSLGKVHCPSFEEWMMGWPEMWTRLMPLETDKFLLWQQAHGLNCTKELPDEEQGT